MHALAVGDAGTDDSRTCAVGCDDALKGPNTRQATYHNPCERHPITDVCQCVRHSAGPSVSTRMAPENLRGAFVRGSRQYAFTINRKQTYSVGLLTGIAPYVMPLAGNIVLAAVSIMLVPVGPGSSVPTAGPRMVAPMAR